MGNSILYNLKRYGILISASYNNEKRTPPLTDTQIRDYDFPVEKIFLEILKHKTGQIIVEGIRSSGYSVVVMPYWYKNCNAETVGRGKMFDRTINVLVGFTPDVSCFLDSETKEFKPGGAPAEALFHELIHAFRLVTEKASNRKMYSNPFLSAAAALKGYQEYDTEEDFFTVLITNIFSSETGRPLRGGHHDNEALPPALSTNKGFLSVEEYARLVRQFCVEHPSVSQQMRDVPSMFNPIKEVLIGQGFQYLVNAGT